MKLYEISKQYMDFLDAVENGDIPPESVVDTLAGIDGEFEEKADNIACLIKRTNAEADAIEQEEKRLYARRMVKKNSAKRLTSYLLEQMQSMGKRKLETSRNVITVAGTAPSVKVANEQALYLIRPDLFSVSTPSLNKVEIKALLNAGEEIPGAWLERGEALRIK